jgi:FkbM family methyltransferase
MVPVLKILKEKQIWLGGLAYEVRMGFSLLFINRSMAGYILRVLNRSACVEESNGNLRLKTKSIFGPVGTSIRIPKDKVIYAYFLKDGYWALPTSYFISKRLKKMRSPLIVDLGAHVGLVSLQSIKLNFNRGRVIAVEALPNHFASLVRNIGAEKLTAFCGALVSDASLVNIKILVDKMNLGNSSAFTAIVPKELGRSDQIEVPVIALNQVTKAINNSGFILKSDLQGYDAGVLANFGDDFWKFCLGGVIEVNAHNEIKSTDIIKLLERLHNYRHISWHPFNLGRISDKEVFDFWTAGNDLERDIFFW